MAWRSKIDEAAARIDGHTVRTPVLTTTALWRAPIEIKLEQLQHSGTFKARGAFNTLRAGHVPPRGVVAASGGNHGAAVAFASNRLGIPAHIFVPEIAGPAKIDLIRQCGADLTVVPGQYSEAAEAADAYAAENGAMQIHPYDAELTVTGQGTLMREWETQGLEADTILIAVGGGGLIAGALAWLQNRRKVVAVEPQSCNALQAAIHAGQPVDTAVSGLAANALGAKRIGKICFDLAQAQGIEVVTTTDAAIAEAQKHLWQAHRLLVEPAGACALAALRSGAYVPDADERVAVLLCGGNAPLAEFSNG